MPELPEVETVRRGLKRLIVGRKILNVEIYNPKSFQASGGDIEQFILGAEIVGARRRAKVLIIDLSTNYSLVIHLKMTGQIVFRGDEHWGAGHPNESFLDELPNKSTRVEFELGGVLSDQTLGRPLAAAGPRLGSRETDQTTVRLFFNDQRKFGWIRLVPTAAVTEMDFIQKLGPEPLTGEPAAEFLKRVRRRNNTTIKAAILDQSVIAGIGNIYADESLWAARVHPATRVRDLSDKKLREILACAIDIMQKSIDSGGSTMKNYVKADGTRGNYLEKFANVFRRDGEACPRCGTTIEKIRVAGRGTHICPKCQKLKT